MIVLSETKQRRHQLGSSRSIRRLLERRWWVVVLALMLTGLGAALTGVLFKADSNCSGAGGWSCWPTFPPGLCSHAWEPAAG